MHSTILSEIQAKAAKLSATFQYLCINKNVRTVCIRRRTEIVKAFYVAEEQKIECFNRLDLGKQA